MAGTRKAARRWSGAVSTVSTFPPPGLFNEDAATIAKVMARPEVSPGGLGAAIRMVTFFANRAGRNLPEARRAVLAEAKQRLRAARDRIPPTPPGARAPGRYRHVALGPVQVARRRGWVMLRGEGEPPIPLGPDGWRYLSPLKDTR